MNSGLTDLSNEVGVCFYYLYNRYYLCAISNISVIITWALEFFRVGRMREKRPIEIRVRCDIDLQKKNDKNFDFFTITTSQ